MDLKKLATSLEEVSSFHAGKLNLKVTEVPPPRVDVRKIRENTGFSQTVFAEHFGFSPSTVRNWEQGAREPEGPARTLLALIEANPKMMEKEIKKLKMAV